MIAISASVYQEDRQLCFDAGCQGFLSKPVDADLLFEQLHRLLGIEWVHEDATEPPGKLLLNLPSSKELEQMMQAALIGDIMDLRQQLEEFERNEPRLHAFVATLRPMVQGIQLPDIQAFLRACLKM